MWSAPPRAGVLFARQPEASRPTRERWLSLRGEAAAERRGVSARSRPATRGEQGSHPPHVAKGTRARHPPQADDGTAASPPHPAAERREARHRTAPHRTASDGGTEGGPLHVAKGTRARHPPPPDDGTGASPSHPAAERREARHRTAPHRTASDGGTEGGSVTPPEPSNATRAATPPTPTPAPIPSRTYGRSGGSRVGEAHPEGTPKALLTRRIGREHSKIGAGVGPLSRARSARWTPVRGHSSEQGKRMPRRRAIPLS